MTTFDQTPTPIQIQAMKCGRIRDAIRGLAYRMAVGEEFLFPCIDYLLLLFQKSRLVISFWKNDQLVFSSMDHTLYLSLCDRTGKGEKERKRIIILKGHDYYASVEEHNRGLLVFCPHETDVLEKLFRGPEIFPPFPSQFLSEVLIQSLEAVKHEGQDNKAFGQMKNEERWDLPDMKTQFEPLRNILDMALFDGGESHFLQPAARNKGFQNVFCVVRYSSANHSRFNGMFNFNSILILSEEQKKCLKRLSSVTSEADTEKALSNLLSKLEAPLGMDSRTIGDDCFTSGSVEFGSVENDPRNVQGSNADVDRVSVEKQINAAMYEGRTGDWHRFYIPIHVGGVPWASFFTVVPSDPSSDFVSWEHNYYVYREISTKLAGQLRARVHDLYLEKLKDVLVSELQDAVWIPKELANSVSRAWGALSHLFPFDIVQLIHVDPKGTHSSTYHLNVPGVGSFQLKFSDNTNFNSQAKYGLLKHDAVLAVLEKGTQSHFNSALGSADSFSTEMVLNYFSIPKHVLGSQTPPPDMAGGSLPMQCIYHYIDEIANVDRIGSPSHVLLLGETGTGKELVAKAIHAKGDRQNGHLEVVNCATLKNMGGGMCYGKLFGWKKGAFTGAEDESKGHFELANGGILFLDEFGELPMEAQTALLRALQPNQQIQPLKGDIISIDVQVIAATSRAIDSMIETDIFRRDLYERFNYVLKMPALRQRKEDLEPLMRKLGLPEDIEIPKTVLKMLRQHRWPGNIRELRRVVHRLRRSAVRDWEFLVENSLKSKYLGLPDTDPNPLDAEKLMRAANMLNKCEEVAAKFEGKRGVNYQTAFAEALGYKSPTYISKLFSYGSSDSLRNEINHLLQAYPYKWPTLRNIDWVIGKRSRNK